MNKKCSDDLTSARLDIAEEIELSTKEKEKLNKRIIDHVRLSQVLKAEFKDSEQNQRL
jgi:hypothetical protein